MGARAKEDSVQFTDSIYQDRSSSKLVRDNVHGIIYLEPLFLKFIDTAQFQRLRDLKQLGLAHMVYPGAVHSRFEHSLGVYSLAGEAINKLKLYHEDLKIDSFDRTTVKLAGLLHDIGHGPFSHMFEREFLPRVINGCKWSHEEMSVNMIEYIVEENNIDIDSAVLKRVKELILASSNHGEQNSVTKNRFLYDIVANGRTGIDVDKFDYMVRDSRACGIGCSFQFERLMETMRVIDDEICYRASDYLTVHKLFATRADLHRTVYTHAKVKAVELMAIDAMCLANSAFKIAESIQSAAEFWKLDDTILKRIETSDDPELKEAKDLIHRIRRRDLYQFCNEYSVPKENLEHFKDITPKDIVCSQKSSGGTLKEEDVAVCTVKIDLTHGTKNPLERINFFKDYESALNGEKFLIQDDRISHLLPTFYQDKIVRVYAKKPEVVAAVSEAFENYQMKTYGRTEQATSSLKLLETNMEGKRAGFGSGKKAAGNIDIRSLDQQLARHLDRLCSMEKKKEKTKELLDGQESQVIRVVAAIKPAKEEEEWQIVPDKLFVKQVFARGTFGSVHRGLYDGQQVAVKFLEWGEEGQNTKAQIASLQNDFRREVSVWHKLDHPNITKFIGAATKTSKLKSHSKVEISPNSACVIAEYLSGGTLKSYLIKHRERKLPLKTVKQMALDLARGLSYLHSKNIVHRDVKSENLLLDKDGRVKIADFGVARFQASNSSEMTGYTGTPGYMAPEVIENKPYDEKCDVYSFGICLWEMYRCDMPYRNVGFSELTTAVVNENLRPEIPKGCPSSLAKVMIRCWDSKPNRRPEMAEVVPMLEAIDSSENKGLGCFSLFSCKQ